MRPGARNLITDVPGLRVGNATDAALKSGVSVLLADRPAVAAVAVMGGAPASHETDLLGADRLVQEVDALVLAGGSAFGLAASTGVMEGLRAIGRGFAVGPVRVPIVPAAAVFDLLNGGAKDWAANPYPDLGRRALAAAAAPFDLGSVGAGTGAMTADLKGGLGSASAVLEGGITVGALVVVNALGSAVADARGAFWAGAWEMQAEFGGLGPPQPRDPGAEPTPAKRLGEATTIAIVATDAILTRAQAQRMATAAHDGMARALVPSHTPFDGDLIFAIATGQRPLADPLTDPFVLGHAAASCLARAIARGVQAASPAAGDLQPCWAGRYPRP